jgi:hypothetical protein
MQSFAVFLSTHTSDNTRQGLSDEGSRILACHGGMIHSPFPDDDGWFLCFARGRLRLNWRFDDLTLGIFSGLLLGVGFLFYPDVLRRYYRGMLKQC